MADTVDTAIRFSFFSVLRVLISVRGKTFSPDFPRMPNVIDTKANFRH